MVDKLEVLKKIVGPHLKADQVLHALQHPNDTYGPGTAMARKVALRIKQELPELAERPALLADMINEIHPPAGRPFPFVCKHLYIKEKKESLFSRDSFLFIYFLCSFENIEYFSKTGVIFL